MSRGRSGPLNGNWVGNQVGYKARHTRVVRARGAAKTHDCAHCAEVGVVTPAHDWATKHDTEGLDVNDYLPLCRPALTTAPADGAPRSASGKVTRHDHHRGHVSVGRGDPAHRPGASRKKRRDRNDHHRNHGLRTGDQHD